MKLQELNSLSEPEALVALQQCCNATNWVQRMADQIPFTSMEDVLNAATAHWSEMQESDWLEAFDGHPKIGDPESLKKKYRSTHALASEEQSSVRDASSQTIMDLAKANQSYVDRFGFIFIICATGKTAEEMLSAILARLTNNREQELTIAAAEQLKITHIRLNSLITQ